MKLDSNVRNYTDKEILDRLMSLDTFTHFPIGFFDTWVRSKEDAVNKFDDKVYTFEFRKGWKLPKFKMVTTGTTNTGLFGLKKFFTYNRLGVAVLKDDIIVYNSHVLGKHKGKYAAYVQSYDVSFPYYRDNNKNDKAECIGKVYYNRIGANCHKAGWWSKLIGKWSLGCLVRNIKSHFDKWMKMLNSQKYLTVAILKEW